MKIKISKKLFLFAFCFIIIVLGFTLLNPTKAAFAATASNEEQEISRAEPTSAQIYTVERTVSELFEDAKISESEYLYNLDGASDYIYVEFENGGYAVFLKDTMEMMEYSVQGCLDYSNMQGIKYYGGPGTYLIKKDDYFVDTISQEHLYISKKAASEFSSKVRLLWHDKNESRVEQPNIKFDYTLSKNVEPSLSSSKSTEQPQGETPKLDNNSLIYINSGTYIPNYQYFLHNPRHGNNSSDTCGAVAAQLLLSYHNYYSDRRIIANNYLNGSSSSPQLNPNLCTDPMSMTSNTLGTRGTREDGSDDSNSYFAYCIDNIPGNATTSQVKNGIGNILNARNNDIGGGISYSLNSKTGGFLFFVGSVNSSGIIAEIDAGRPTIILMQESLGGSDHYVVAYGYTNYTYPNSTDTYLGYITHFGWGSGYLNIWINSSWCYSYITLNINHEHNFNTVGSFGTPGRVESKCSICGYRTDAVIKMLSNERYLERVVTLPQNGYNEKEYQITFQRAGIKIIQTFGSKDTYLYLYDSNHNLLKSNDDGGYSTNALINYTVSANTTYYIKVRFYSSSQSGQIRLAILPYHYSTVDTYEKIDNIDYTGYSFGLDSNIRTGSVILYTFTPAYSTLYTLYTTASPSGRIDMYLYLIDPRSTDIISTTMTDDSVYNDDGNGDLQAKIEKEVEQGVPYLLIISPYNLDSSGRFLFDIYRGTI